MTIIRKKRKFNSEFEETEIDFSQVNVEYRSYDSGIEADIRDVRGYSENLDHMLKQVLEVIGDEGLIRKYLDMASSYDNKYRLPGDE